jgi:hypothetical protein
MAGQRFFKLFYLIPENPVPDTPELDLPTDSLFNCCGDFSFKVLANTASNDEHQNDVTGFLWWFNSVVDVADLTLWKYQNGAYAQVAAFTDDTYGTNYAYGFYENNQSEKFVGYQLAWKEVLNAFGEGSYKVKCAVELGYGGTSTLESQEYCLKTYTAARANGTVKVEYYLNGIIGDISNDKKKVDLGTLNWYNAMRLRGYFGFPSSTYKNEYIRYQPGNEVWVESDQDQEFEMKILYTFPYVHRVFRTNVMQADQIFITDYNKNNETQYVQKEVIPASEYKPTWYKLKSKLASVELKFKPAYNNNKKLRN